MSSSSEKLKKLAEINFCEDCYNKYLLLIQGEIEYLLSEPIADWRQTEHNIDVLWIKAKRLYDLKSSMFHPNANAFQKAKEEKLWKKLKFLRANGIINNFTYKFLDKVSTKRNKIHSLSKLSKEDYILFREANAITSIMNPIIIFDLKEPWHKQQLDYVENRAKWLLEKTELF